jgi:hypothetical protein
MNLTVDQVAAAKQMMTQSKFMEYMRTKESSRREEQVPQNSSIIIIPLSDYR